ncbi:MAG: hypothetical protein HKN32_05560 [Flavobacteriales bacterium]|nr:hypothetical protein [Flavobacteriales bacterium]
MKKALLTFALGAALCLGMQAQEYMILTTVESIVPGGLGRSRMIMENSDINVDEFTTERTDGKKSNQGDVKRGEAKIDSFTETKLLNFYSMVGINFQNIASNDALVSDRLNKLAAEGWELKFVSSGVEADAGKADGVGIFITRYIFTK